MAEASEAVGTVRAVFAQISRLDPLFMHGVGREGLFTAALDCLYPVFSGRRGPHLVAGCSGRGDRHGMGFHDRALRQRVAAKPPYITPPSQQHAQAGSKLGIECRRERHRDIVSAYGGQLWVERPSRVMIAKLGDLTRPDQAEGGSGVERNLSMQDRRLVT
jgi:hypothetical protein